MKETIRKRKLVVIERDRSGNVLRKVEIPVSSDDENSIINKINNKKVVEYRKTYDYYVRNNQRKNNFVQNKDRIDISR
jgi:hypothetical protein